MPLAGGSVIAPALIRSGENDVIEIMALVLKRVGYGIINPRIVLKSKLDSMIAASGGRVTLGAPYHSLPALIPAQPHQRVVNPHHAILGGNSLLDESTRH